MAIHDNLASNVLFGAPYVKGNEKELETLSQRQDIFVFNLDTYAGEKTEFFNRINQHIEKRNPKKLINQIEILENRIESRTYQVLGLAEGDKIGLKKALNILNNKVALERAILEWLSIVAEKAVQGAQKNLSTSQYKSTAKRREYMYKNAGRYFHSADKEFEKVSEALSALGTLDMVNQEDRMKKIVKEMLFGNRKNSLPTLSSQESNKRGPVGELAVALAQVSGDLIGDSIDDFLEQFDKAVSFMGTEGGKGDVSFKSITGLNISYPIVISVKNYEKILKKGKNNAFTDAYETVTVNSGGNFTDFFNEFKKKIDPDLDVSNIVEKLNTYWLNVLYFRNKNFPLTHDIMYKEFEDTRAKMNALMNTYGMIYLMLGYDEDVNSFLQGQSDKINNKNTALFFSLAGVGIVPYFEILQQLRNGMKIAENPDVKLTFHTPGAGDISKIDRESSTGAVQGQKASKNNAEKHNIFTANGPYAGTVRNLVGKNSMKTIENRYNAWSSVVKTKVELHIRGRFLRNLLDEYLQE